MAKSKKSLGSTDGAKAQNAEWFATDIIIDDYLKLVISIAENTGVIVEITKNSGSDWVSLNSNVLLIANSEHTFDVHVKPGDLFNIRTPTGGGTTIFWARVAAIQTEG